MLIEVEEETVKLELAMLSKVVEENAKLKQQIQRAFFA